jgi:hypothetical protein
VSFDPRPIADEPQALGASSGSEQRRRRRRRALRRFDVALGLIVGVIWIVVAPGIAIAGIIAALVLALAGISFLVTRRRARGRGVMPRRLRRRRRAAL